MIDKPKRGLFITGTNTEVGKTYVSTLIVRALVDAGHRVGVYKPAASDCVSDQNGVASEDAIALWQSAGCPLTLEQVCPQRYKAAMAPHLAAQAEGKSIDADLLRSGIAAWTDQCDIVVVEGPGGLMSPISEDEYVADLAFDFGYPTIIVAPNELGVINHTLMTLITAECFRDGIDVVGVVVNDSSRLSDDASTESNAEQIAKRSYAPVLAHVKNEAIEFDKKIDWFGLAGKDINEPTE